ncbi:hypothetical protein V5O48_001369 [Marasmius crinis-equi]|uniref:Zinc-finger domain-containing protein n=1 Tax=Marasmius crinis-equi TaxID=585013 RepID=A0ABR3FYN6_9AGAR
MQDQEMLGSVSTPHGSHLESAREPSPSVTPAQSTSDPTLLRAAALSTLKSKRRKPASSQSSVPLSRPVVIDNSVQLDYGQDDSEPSRTEGHPTYLHPNTSAEDLQDPQSREEGEISDSEEASGLPKSVEQPTPPSPSNIPTEPEPEPTTSSDVHLQTRTSLPPDEVAPLKSESPPPPSTLLDRISDPDKPAPDAEGNEPSLSESHPADTMDVDLSGPFVDENHVRPGLNMTQDQYDTAKDTILDLLGWGVPPGYLVNCGLSREIVFYVFSELNLRLPDDFDTHDLIPFNPSTVRMLIRGPTPSREEGPSTSTPGSPSKVVGSPDVSTLHDMEKQRRQELLARKAVHASRKGKAPMSDSIGESLTDTHDGDVEMSVPTETVDSFLKTIEPGDEPQRTHSPRQDHDPMDIDKPATGPQDTEIEQDDHTEPPNSASVPPTSADSHTYDQISRRSSSSGDISISSMNGQKRGTKRPVAADFVDFDHSPHPRNGHVHPALKRKTGSFASIGVTPRRCVIDLSDDEDDGDPARPRDAYEPPMTAPPFAGDVGHSTPPVGPSSASTPRMSSPGALVEKERQIEEMRQKIAQREKVKHLRFKEQKTIASGSANTETSVSVKQEELESPLASEAAKSLNNGRFDHMDGGGCYLRFLLRRASMKFTRQKLRRMKLWAHLRKNRTERPAPQDQVELVDVEPKLSSSAQASLRTYQHRPRLDENQVQSQEKHENEYPAYRSIFDGYPLLRSRPSNVNEDRSLMRADESFSSSSTIPSLPSAVSFVSTSTSSTSLDSSAPSPVHPSHVTLALPDLQPLKLGAMIQAFDPTKRICQYEIPGGGICRDMGCEDNHPSRMDGLNPASQQSVTAVEPSDQDAARYLSNFAPESWQSAYGSSLADKIIAALEEARVKYPSMAFDERVASAMTAVEQQSSLPLPTS